MTTMNAAERAIFSLNIKVNNQKHTIEISKTVEKAAARFGSEAYVALLQVRQENPGYSVKVVSHKTSKPSYDGLTYEYMKAYISKHDKDDGSIGKEFLELRAKDALSEEMGAKSASYQDILEWFLETYPAIKEYHEKRAAKLENCQKKRIEEREKRLREAKHNAA